MIEQFIGSIGDKYSIILEKSNGGFATVYLVKDNKTNKEYAAKVLDRDDYYESEFAINKILKDLNIPNVVKFIVEGNDLITLKKKEPEKKKYLIFEYYSKENLLSYIKHSGGLKEIYSKVLFKKLLETIQLLHNNGIFHLDLKLNNILLDGKYNPIIADFGFSKTIKESINNKFSGSFGTNKYMPPQMFLDEKFDGTKADILYFT